MTAQETDRSALIAECRPPYLADIAAGIERFFEPRRETCPWCGSTRLMTWLRTTDLLQHKPGRFTLDRCADCGHIFQNPRLNPQGLEFYYRDFYDGLGEKTLDSLFAKQVKEYRSRATTLRPFTTPESWLDVGTGHGHFPKVAKELFPDTRFDGLDFSDGINLAEQRGWIHRGYRGHFVELAEELSESYDAISMLHYLEHTPEPWRELEAALTTLRPGGHLLIELPDPECGWASVLGRWWIPWLQPQHLHMISIANLRAALTELDFTVVCEQRAEAHSPYDLAWAAALLLHAALRGEDVPWEPHPPSRVRRIVRNIGIKVAMPVLVAAALLDRALAPIGRKRGMSNAYRVVARKN
jgi:Methylase involved in ubiquinone/menaquinone biosynthesis